MNVRRSSGVFSTVSNQPASGEQQLLVLLFVFFNVFKLMISKSSGSEFLNEKGTMD